MLQRYGGVGQSLMGAGPSSPQQTAPATPITPGTASRNASIDERLNSQTKPQTTSFSGHQANVNRRKRQESAAQEQKPLAGIGGNSEGPTGSFQTPMLQQALQSSPNMQALIQQTEQAAQRFRPQQVSASVQSQSPVPQSGSVSEYINSRNPEARADRPYVQGGDTGGYLQGIGATIGAGRSITSDLAKQQTLQAMQQGVPIEYINDFLQRNPGDTNRLIEGYNSERRNTRGGSWQDYALPSLEEAASYFG